MRQGYNREQRIRSHTRGRLNVASEVRVAVTTETVEERLAALEQAVTDLGGQVNEVIEETITPAELSVLPGLKVLRPIPIVIEESADDVIARWIEPGLTGVGGSEGAAIDSLAAVIVDVWTDLRSENVRLAGNAGRMLAVIENYAAPAP